MLTIQTAPQITKMAINADILSIIWIAKTELEGYKIVVNANIYYSDGSKQSVNHIYKDAEYNRVNGIFATYTAVMTDFLSLNGLTADIPQNYETTLVN